MEPKRTVLWLIHGTWAREAKWTQPGSVTRKTLEENIIGDVEFRRFEWTGRNRSFDRFAAADSLIQQARAERKEAEVHLIVAHSHGGNVAAHSLQVVDTPFDGAITLNTPFISWFRRDRFLMSLHGVLLMLAVGAFVGHFVHRGAVAEVVITAAVWSIIVLLLLLLFLVPKLRGPPSYDFFHHMADEPPPMLCITALDDEATSWLEFFDVVVNVPYLLLHRITLPLSFALVVLLHAVFGLPFAQATLELWWVNLAQTVSGGSWVDMLRMHPPDLPKAEWIMFSDNLRSLSGAGPWLVTLGSSFEYWLLGWAYVAVGALVLSYFVRGLVFGSGFGAMAVIQAFSVRLRVHTKPVSHPGSRLWAADRPSEQLFGAWLRHSDLHENELVLQKAATWINERVLSLDTED